MDRIDIDTWANISAEGWSSLLLGNGASIAIHKEFSYPTLYSVADAKWLLATTAPIFAKLGTTRLRACSARLLVCRACQRGPGNSVCRHLCSLCGSTKSTDRGGAQYASGACRCRSGPAKGRHLRKLVPYRRQFELRPHSLLGDAAVQCSKRQLVQRCLPSW